jgi:hypothetical protein
VAATGVNDIPAADLVRPQWLRRHQRPEHGGGRCRRGNIDEKTNLQGGTHALIARDPGDGACVPGGAFDDMVIWLSPNILYNRMVAAQRLP